MRNVNADFEFNRLVIILNYYFQFMRPSKRSNQLLDLINSWLLSIDNF